MTEKQYRRQWLRWHGQYEKIAYKEFVAGFRALGNEIPFYAMTEDNYDLILDGNFEEEKFYQIYYNVYNKVGLIQGERVGKQLNKEIKEFTLSSFISLFERNLLTWLFDNAASRVITVRQTYLEYLKELIAIGINDGKSMSQIATDLTKQINQRNFYRWQALRIARTETTAAANYASMIAADSSGVLTEKIWISDTGARTRRTPRNQFNHLKMNGVRVGRHENFKVPSRGRYEELEYPGAPKNGNGNKSSGDNVINCRCNAALVAKRDANGRLVRA